MPESLTSERDQGSSRDIVTATMESCEKFAVLQRAWATTGLTERLAVLSRARHIFVERISDLCEAISTDLARNGADTRVAEVLPLLSACRFLEREAADVLATRRLGRQGRPFWLGGISTEIHRVPMGRVLIIAPSNYPLFLPGVQVLQALVAGNSVVWKPGRGGRAVAEIFATVLQEAGLPQGLLEVTDESVQTGKSAIASGVDKVFFTGSAGAGRAVMRQLAETLTPCVAELSGCDAVFVLPSASVPDVAKALAFGMRLNGSATCMAPRRVILVGANEQRRKDFLESLLAAVEWVRAVQLPEDVCRELHLLVDDAWLSGARVYGRVHRDQQHPIVITGATPELLAAKTDIFAPILSIMEAPDAEAAVAIHEVCPYALTASVFGKEHEGRELASRLTAGTVTINDLIVPTADPRVPFGGRRGSGFGSTRGVEGLLEMTAPMTIAVRRGNGTRHFDATTQQHEALFDGVIKASHAKKLIARLRGVQQIISAASKFGKKK